MHYQLNEEAEILLQETWQRVQSKLAITQKRIGSSLPYISKNHKYIDMGSNKLNWWTNGFWPGILWQMYAATKKSAYLKTARCIEEKLEITFKNPSTLDHDVGFIWLNAAVTDYHLTGNVVAKKRALTAADILAKRYNPIGKYLLAWNGIEKKGQVIVDCFMNLPLLYWASAQTGDSKFEKIATAHAYTATKALLRADGSVNHIAVFDPQTGQFEQNLGGQGYSSDSSWARGQAWAIYGLVLAYKNVKDVQFLNQAKLVANYFIANVSTTDDVSLIDFRAPSTPVYYDTTATAIAICGLLELVRYLPLRQQALYKNAAFKMFKALTQRYCDFSLKDDELLTCGSAKYHRESDREVPIIYGDAFYLEALLRFLNLDLKIYSQEDETLEELAIKH
ncbi:glycoside hydrolase family 88 protein [Agrilactobacillus yilanensis]|uniref:Glycoside hydrolase family 88 protein n=1 Tax=Agrilactobacillus yilanensis TaxID=2485997 RepID=A0ABW4J482_9LACO|nr:glycoside hydrolase family 88 protein [Agrilactobacillus yilanensis]